MKVLVTGHKGFIGAVLVPRLLAKGHKVAGYDCDLYRRCSFGKEPVQIPELKKDIRDVELSELRGFDAVIHLAALSNDPLGNLNPDLTYAVNYEASVRLAELSKKAGVQRFLFSSSCSNYGASDDEFLTEEAGLRPVTPYGTSKVLVEKQVMKLADSEFSPTFLRNATAYGVSPRHRFDLVLNNLVAWACTTGRVHLKSDGTAWRPLIHVEDIALAFITMLQAPREKVYNQIFNVALITENYQIRDIARLVRETVPNCSIEFAQGAETDTRCYRVDGGKLQRTFPEYTPMWNVRKGAHQLYQAYCKTELTLTDFEGPKYKRIDHVKQLMKLGLLDKDLRWQSNLLESSKPDMVYA